MDKSSSLKEEKKHVPLFSSLLIIWYIQQVQKWEIKTWNPRTRKYPRWDHQISIFRFLTRSFLYCSTRRQCLC